MEKQAVGNEVVRKFTQIEEVDNRGDHVLAPLDYLCVDFVDVEFVVSPLIEATKRVTDPIWQVRFFAVHTPRNSNPYQSNQDGRNRNFPMDMGFECLIV